ncbi:hypothetical protein [Hydrogenoanaerobacterium sp.]|uniref:hypothetical protein n=1 Tax=Hydrogenoanaerobacterium sp. TaxID=2953763 RepID=UPI00289B3E89|nr:hypothetical protein [Hydrogenoanaerobacterium sp.]
MEALEQLIDERSEKAMAELRENPEFMALLVEQQELLEALLAKISDKQTQKAVMAYDEQKNAVSGIQLKAVYKAGALDAVKLLKTLGVI